MRQSRALDYFARVRQGAARHRRAAVKEFFPREALQVGEIRDLERSLRDAQQYKFTASQLTQQTLPVVRHPLQATANSKRATTNSLSSPAVSGRCSFRIEKDSSLPSADRSDLCYQLAPRQPHHRP
jgi:hypothetical protein